MTKTIHDKELKTALEKIAEVKAEIAKRIVGQEILIRNLLIALIAKGHIILEGVPGLAKTMSIEALSQTLHLSYKRIQFTPDLLPSDLIGSKIFNQSNGEFSVKKGPIFANFILTDEINRAPSKVQSALLEAMQERQVTIGEDTFKLDKPFIVLATQNPIEQEGTYSLPEAQVDRFLLKTILDYPNEEQEIQIMKNETGLKHASINRVMTLQDIHDIQDLVTNIHVSDDIFNYVKDLIFATRDPKKYGIDKLVNLLAYGASPRASIALIVTSKILAFMNGRNHVTPDDVKEIAYDTLRHRLIPSYDAIAEDIKPDDLVKILLDNVNTP